MKKLLLLLILLLPLVAVHAQFEDDTEDWDVSDTLFRKKNFIVYRGQKNSLIQWDRLNPLEWMDIELWKRESLLKDETPEWEKIVRERRLKERVGRVIECVGDCRNYRGVGFSRMQYKSEIREGDEIITMGDSYLWIFLFDGTLVRMSPDSSISFKEINIGVKENFLHARLNSGNILWLARTPHEYQVSDARETDSLFLPLSMYDANPPIEKVVIDEDNLYKLLEDKLVGKKKYSRLNALIRDNNVLIDKKPTYSFLVMPNGTLFGKNLSMEFIVLLGGESYFKRREEEQLLKQKIEDWEIADLEFYYRGFENKKVYNPEVGKWYMVQDKGREVVEYSGEQKYHMGEYVTKHIPSIYIARELMIKKYSSFAFESLKEKELAYDHGYKLWTPITEDNGELNLRLRYLREYTRRIETTNLLVASQFKRKLERRGVISKSMVYSNKFYKKALDDYTVFKDSNEIIETDREKLNSTKKPFWKKINGIRE